MSTIKAYKVGDSSEEYAWIVFAASAGRARSLARGLDGLEYDGFLDIRVRRLPEADKYGTGGEGALDWGRGSNVYWQLGWHPEDGGNCCEECSRYQFDDVPESCICIECLWCHDCGHRPECPIGGLPTVKCADCQKERGSEEGWTYKRPVGDEVWCGACAERALDAVVSESPRGLYE